MNVVPNENNDMWYLWTDPGETFEFRLLQAGFSPSTSDVFADDLSSEISVSGYSRPTMANPVRDVLGIPDHLTTYACDPFTFGTLTAGQNYQWVVCVRVITNDADSPIMGYWDLGILATSGLSVTPELGTDNVIHYLHNLAT